MTDRKIDVPKWIMIYDSLLVIVGLGSGMIGLLPHQNSSTIFQTSLIGLRFHL